MEAIITNLKKSYTKEEIFNTVNFIDDNTQEVIFKLGKQENEGSYLELTNQAIKRDG